MYPEHRYGQVITATKADRAAVNRPFIMGRYPYQISAEHNIKYRELIDHKRKKITQDDPYRDGWEPRRWRKQS